MYFNNKTNVLTTVAPWGNTVYADRIKKKRFPDWEVVDDNFKIPEPEVTPDESDKDERAKSIAEYNEIIKGLSEAINLALLEGDDDLVAELREEYQEVKTSYQDVL